MRLFFSAIAALWIFGVQLTAQVHVSPFAGQWFPAEKPELEEALKKAFAAAEERAGSNHIRKPVLALVVPHAAMRYSGVVAASAYRLLDNPDNIILLAFSHKRPIQGIVAPDIDAYVTPLGQVKVNRAVLEELGVPFADEAELCDHSLEIQLPFLQHAAPGTTITPLYVGNLSDKALAAAARGLADRVSRGDILIASSDFTHYGKAYGYEPYPNNAELPRHLFWQAMTAFEEIGSTDIGEFDSYLASTGDNICGVQPIRLLMETLASLEENAYLQLLDYMTSADFTGDQSASVGYGALAFFPDSAFWVGTTDQRTLLRSARATLTEHLSNGDKAAAPLFQGKRSPDLEQRTGVFVTLRKEGKIRGCVGTLASREPLWETVMGRTLAAAKSDHRFPPLTENEGPVTLEISILTTVKKIKNWRKFRTGLGAILTLGDRGATLLPQVAAEMDWDKRKFLENLSIKAGLPRNAYRNPNARLYVFEAQIFGEDIKATATSSKR